MQELFDQAHDGRWGACCLAACGRETKETESALQNCADIVAAFEWQNPEVGSELFND